MPLTLGPLFIDAGVDPSQALVIHHAYARKSKESGLIGLRADSTHAEILEYTRNQSSDSRRFPVVSPPPPPICVVFIKEGGDQARLWSVVENHGLIADNGVIRTFDVSKSGQMADLRNRLVVGWKSPRTWRMNSSTAASYPVVSIADAEPVSFLPTEKVRKSLSFRDLSVGLHPHGALHAPPSVEIGSRCAQRRRAEPLGAAWPLFTGASKRTRRAPILTDRDPPRAFRSG